MGVTGSCSLTGRVCYGSMEGGVVSGCVEACSKIVSRCLDAIVNVSACKELAKHIRDLSAILPELQKMEDTNVLPSDAQQVPMYHPKRILWSLGTPLAGKSKFNPYLKSWC